jgi:hypothetical protein
MKNKKIPHKVQSQNQRNKGKIDTLTRLTWYRHIDKKWQVQTSYMDQNLPCPKWIDVIMCGIFLFFMLSQLISDKALSI